MEDFGNIELQSVHYVKVLLCYLLNKLRRPVTEEQLYEIVIKSEVVNYFCFTQALGELLENCSAVRTERDGKTYLELTGKGRHGGEYFADAIPLYFRKQLLREALRYFAALERESAAQVTIEEARDGYEVQCTISDGECVLLRQTIYAPDMEQAALIRDNIKQAPLEYYRAVMGFVLDNRPDETDAEV